LKEEQYLQAGSEPFPRDCSAALSEGADLSQVIGEEHQKGGVGSGEVEREENQVYTALHKALFICLSCFGKGGSECKGNTNSSKCPLLVEL